MPLLSAKDFLCLRSRPVLWIMWWGVLWHMRRQLVSASIQTASRLHTKLLSKLCQAHNSNMLCVKKLVKIPHLNSILTHKGRIRSVNRLMKIDKQLFVLDWGGTGGLLIAECDFVWRERCNSGSVFIICGPWYISVYCSSNTAVINSEPSSNFCQVQVWFAGGKSGKSQNVSQRRGHSIQFVAFLILKRTGAITISMSV